MSSWKLRSICTLCCNLEHFLLCSTLEPFSEAAAEVFKFFCAVSSSAGNILLRWRHYLAHRSSRAFVCQTNVNCVFFYAALCTRDGEPRCPGRVPLPTGFTSLLMKQGGIFSGLQSLLMLALAPRNDCLLALTICKSTLVPVWQKHVRGACLDREKSNLIALCLNWTCLFHNPQNATSVSASS